MRNDCLINFHLSKLSIAKFSILCDISLVRDWKRKLKLITLGSDRVKFVLSEWSVTHSHNSLGRFLLHSEIFFFLTEAMFMCYTGQRFERVRKRIRYNTFGSKASHLSRSFHFRGRCDVNRCHLPRQRSIYKSAYSVWSSQRPQSIRYRVNKAWHGSINIGTTTIHINKD